MIIDYLGIRNFRSFEEASISLDNRVSVLVGVNGSGKSTVLDAMSILLSCYVGGFDGLGPQRIAQSDIRHVTHKSGSFYNNTAQLPVMLSATGTIGLSHVTWGSVKLKDSPYSASPSAYEAITALATEHQDRLRQGDDMLTLPLMAHYGAGRLWRPDSSKRRRESQLATTPSRLTAYDDCLDAHLTDTMLASWFERMTIKRLQQGSDIPEFAAVRQAVASALKSLTGFDNVELQVNFDTHEVEVVYDVDGSPAKVASSQLSDGYRVALNLFADIAYRAAMLNPQLGDAVLEETEGIVLVDEVDLHLHPKWQQLVLDDLGRTFPKIQFVVTTHAPSVVSSAKGGQLIMADGKGLYSVDDGFYGKDANTILREIMGAQERPRAIRDLFDRFYRCIDSGKYEDAERVLESLGGILGGTDPELTACGVQLELERMDLS